MTTTMVPQGQGAKNLLLLRLDALAMDIAKVRAAVERAEQRGEYLREAMEFLTPHIRELRTVRDTLSSLVTAMTEESQIAELLVDVSLNLDRDLRVAPDLVQQVLSGVMATQKSLSKALATTVSLKEPSLALQQSLNHRCSKLQDSLSELQADIVTSGSTARREHWETYQRLLDEVARPVFVEYVDFLGGLTVRDTGLDDLVCDMTEAVLGRFKSLTTRSLPLPGRQAALGNALDSVVVLGFPEWSIWGIPLVGHEVGLAYIKDRKDSRLTEVIDRYVPEKGGLGWPDLEFSHNEELVQQLLADAFATYTLGFPYACAALLLRLHPRHDEPRQADRPRDIDRARVIIMTLEAGGEKAMPAGGTFSDSVALLEEIWRSAVIAHAAPSEADAAAQETEGPPPSKDWLDDLTRDAVQHFQEMSTIMPFNEERWRGSQEWLEILGKDASAGPLWSPVEHVVVDVLTAAWRLRLSSEGELNKVAQVVQRRWSTRRRGA